MVLEDISQIPAEPSNYCKSHDKTNEKSHSKCPGHGLGPFFYYSTVHEPYWTLSLRATSPHCDKQCQVQNGMNAYLRFKRSSPYYVRVVRERSPLISQPAFFF